MDLNEFVIDKIQIGNNKLEMKSENEKMKRTGNTYTVFM